ncbi:MAG: hypothetical protein KDK36_11770 [Leptospiraceae bacterium]|nr:hypothetical protein [Leptospiraceae bacterium]
MYKIPSLFASYLVIIETTIREAMRKRLLIVILFITALFLLMNITCSSTICSINGEQQKTNQMLDEFFFFFLVTFWNFGIAEQITSSLVTEELENKNYLIFLSKPISKLNYYIGKSLGIIVIILVNTLLIYTVYSISTMIRIGSFNPNLWKAVIPMILGFIELVSIVVFLSLIINKTGAVMLSSAFVIIVMILNGMFYEPKIEEAIVQQGFSLSAGEVMYWVLPQLGTLYYYCSSLFQKELTQAHFLGEYSMIQVSIWIVLTWIGIWRYLEQKEFEG